MITFIEFRRKLKWLTILVYLKKIALSDKNTFCHNIYYLVLYCNLLKLNFYGVHNKVVCLCY